ncbi:MAG: M20/M25/M40 family metallo-hydrolase [Acidobacteriota bacterium]|nr:M20/M25/M40 family metallo-hydrolase [Acidobacteriota bacterium]
MRSIASILVALALLCAAGVPVSATPAETQERSLAEIYQEPAGQILGAALVDEQGWRDLTYLTTVIGHRLSGSPQLEEAIDWALQRMREDGLDTAHRQPVMVPHWVRGDESAEVLAPRPRRLNILGLGRSVGTPPEGITAPVVVVESFDELEALGREAVEGKIVAYAVPWVGYRGTVAYRSRGASRAAALGAVAVLVRSATGSSLDTPHTGALRYDDEQPQIPAASMTPEDSEWFKRMEALGQEVTVRLKMEAKTLEDALSANLVVEIPGREKPEEVVVMGGHYDSWDVGQGAHDDGAACVAAWRALALIHQLGLQPRRTLRVVLWTNEENGLAGGRAYHENLGEAVRQHVAAIEMDGGAEMPVGFALGWAGVGRDSEDPEADSPDFAAAMDTLRDIAQLLAAIEADEITSGGGGADIGPLMRDGVPGLALRTVGEHYFDWHHTNADTLDKVDPTAFRRAIAMLGIMGYVLADMPGRLLPPEFESPHP